MKVLWWRIQDWLDPDGAEGRAMQRIADALRRSGISAREATRRLNAVSREVKR